MIVIGGLGFGFYSSWQVSLFLLAVIPFVALSTRFLVKMNQTQTARANSSYSKAGSIVYTAVSSIRTILSLNAVDGIIEKFYAATQEALEGATNQVLLVGLANGASQGSFMLVYIPVTLNWIVPSTVFGFKPLVDDESMTYFGNGAITPRRKTVFSPFSFESPLWICFC